MRTGDAGNSASHAAMLQTLRTSPYHIKYSLVITAHLHDGPWYTRVSTGCAGQLTRKCKTKVLEHCINYALLVGLNIS